MMWDPVAVVMLRPLRDTELRRLLVAPRLVFERAKLCPLSGFLSYHSILPLGSFLSRVHHCDIH